MTRVADFIIQWLEAEKLPYLFGLPGGQIGAMYDALYQNRAIKSILIRHEQNAAFMADAVARTTGRFGACFATIGPGALNLVSGLGIAYADSIPVLAITGDAPLRFPKGKGAREDDVNQLNLFKNVTKWNAEIVRPEHTPEIMATAFRNMFSGRPGPVHINVPQDILESQLTYSPEVLAPERTRMNYCPLCSPESAISKVAEHLLMIDKIVIFADASVAECGACDELQRLAHILSAPVVTTYRGRGVISEASPHAFGIPGAFGVPEANMVLTEAGAILALGVKFDEFATRGWTIPPKSTPVIHIDVDSQEIGKNYAIAHGLIGDIKAILQRLLSFLEQEKKPAPKPNPGGPATENNWMAG